MQGHGKGEELYCTASGRTEPNDGRFHGQIENQQHGRNHEVRQAVRDNVMPNVWGPRQQQKPKNWVNQVFRLFLGLVATFGLLFFT